LIMNTRLYYSFHDAQSLDEAAFEKRLDAVVRELGDRGKPLPPVPEGIPPAALAPAPAPALAPAPAPAPAVAAMVVPVTPARTPAASPDRSFTPTMQQLMSPTVVQQHDGSMGGLGELCAFMEKQHMLLIERETQARENWTNEKAELKAEMEATIAKLTPRLPVEAVSGEQLVTLQVRLEGMHAAKLLTDEVRACPALSLSPYSLYLSLTTNCVCEPGDIIYVYMQELYGLEDLVADFAELKMSMPGQLITEVMIYTSTFDPLASKVHKLVGVSAAVASDATFARQLRRKFL
jgi:hypothetical protein